MTLAKCNWCDTYFEGGDGWHCEDCDKPACTKCCESILESVMNGYGDERVVCEDCLNRAEAMMVMATYDPDHGDGEEPSIDEVNNVP